MWKTVMTILAGRQARAEEGLIEANAALILEQKIREAEAGHNAAKHGLAALIARSKSERRAFAALSSRIADLESRTRAALDAGKEALAADAAKLLADLENERDIRARTLAASDEKADRMRLAIEKTHRQLIDLRQGLITAKALEAERAAMRNMKGDLSANAAIREGERVLKRLLESTDPSEEIEARDEIEAALSGETIIDQMAAAGFGKATKIRPEDVLERLRAAPAPAAH